jgi:hypothetical protein
MKGCMEKVKVSHYKHTQQLNALKDENRLLKVQIKRYKEMTEKAVKDTQTKVFNENRTGIIDSILQQNKYEHGNNPPVQTSSKMTNLNPFKEHSGTRGDQSERSGSILSNKHLSNFNIRVDDNNNVGSGNLTMGEGMDSSMQVSTGYPHIQSNHNSEMKHLNLGQLLLNKGAGGVGGVSGIVSIAFTHLFNCFFRKHQVYFRPLRQEGIIISMWTY